MNIYFVLDATLTAIVVVCFVILATYNLRYFCKSAPNAASYALGLSHCMFAISLSLRLTTMMVQTPLVVGWVGRMLRTLAYLYLVYAFMLVKMPCHVPLFQALSCPYCALDLLEPRRCRRSAVHLLFTCTILSILVSNAVLLGWHPMIQAMIPAPGVGYFWYSPYNRLPLLLAAAHLFMQTAAAACTSLLIMKMFTKAWVTVVLAMSLTLNVVGYTLFIWLSFLELELEGHTALYGTLRIGYSVAQFAHTLLYLIPSGWIIFAESTHDLFDAQRQAHLLTMSDRMTPYVNMYQQSINEAIRGE